MSPALVGVLALFAFVALMFLRWPVGFGMMMIGFAGMTYVGGYNSAISVLGTVPYRICTSYVLSCLPMFVLMGFLAMNAGLTGEVYEAIHRWLGHLRGGVGMATVVAGAFIATVTGSAVTAVATLTMVALPEMRKLRYADRLSLGCIAAAAQMGPIIPPSTTFVIYAWLTEVSIGKLFIAGILPGIMLTVMFVIMITIMVRVNPGLAYTSAPDTWKRRIQGLGMVWPVAVVFILVLGGIYTGIFVPTEAGAVGAFCILLIGLSKRKLGIKGFSASLLETARLTGMVFILASGAETMNRFLAVTRVPYILADTLLELPIAPLAIVGMILFVYFFFGFFIDVMAVIFITVPLLYPAVRAMGFDLIWFGVLVCFVVLIGHLTPPFGTLVFTMNILLKGETPIWSIFKATFPVVGTMCVAMVLLLYFPQIALWLVGLMRPW